MKWEFNKKNTTYAIYACGVILFAVLCIGFLVNRESYVGVFKGFFSDVISPIFYGLIIAYLLNPILKTFEKLFHKASKGKLTKKGLRATGIIATYFVFLAVVTAFCFVLFPQFYQSVVDLIDQAIHLVNNVPIYLQELIDTNEAFATLYETLITNFDLPGLLSELQGNIGSMLKSTSEFLLSFVGVVFNLLLGLFFSIYFLASKELLTTQIKRFFLAFFSFRRNVALGHFITTVDSKFGQFIRGKIIDSTIVMFIVYILTWIFGIPYYPMIALVIGITDLIPVFGPFIGAIPSAVIILIAPTGGLRDTIVFVLLILLVQQIDGNILAPAILGDRVGMSGVWIMIAVTAMGGIFGIFGMFFGVPVFAVIYTLVGEAIEKRLVKKGLAEQLEDENEEPTEEKPNLFQRIKARFTEKKAEAEPSAEGETASSDSKTE